VVILVLTLELEFHFALGAAQRATAQSHSTCQQFFGSWANVEGPILEVLLVLGSWAFANQGKALAQTISTPQHRRMLWRRT